MEAILDSCEFSSSELRRLEKTGSGLQQYTIKIKVDISLFHLYFSYKLLRHTVLVIFEGKMNILVSSK